MLEVFKEIQGYEGMYAISNFGRVYSLPRKDSAGRNKKGGIFLKHSFNGRYYFVNLTKDDKYKSCLIHRLIAMHFIANLFQFPYVDHIDQDKTNNQINNLRWVTAYMNSHNIDKCNSRSKLKIKNISFNEKRNKYVFTKCIKGKHYMKRFKTLEEAIQYKEKFEKKIKDNV